MALSYTDISNTAVSGVVDAEALIVKNDCRGLSTQSESAFSCPYRYSVGFVTGLESCILSDVWRNAQKAL